MVLLCGIAVCDDSGLILAMCQPQVAEITAPQPHRLHNSYTYALDTAATVMRRAAVLAQQELSTSHLHGLMHGVPQVPT